MASCCEATSPTVDGLLGAVKAKSDGRMLCAAEAESARVRADGHTLCPAFTRLLMGMEPGPGCWP
eukprot:CAMPEP_0171074542 /NCGR_PEP_ID=MMETSP0766_2-20121228/12209_1 /TAXON_ID=439317 /ORGANISM="Gambierdiscus australes, Strain CAWD 149" /LENGTH=64 /DNA_ID=CAMNT_0011531345 /DNA_START=337 /DNA_END=531 /DNA_ORIENTATION=-